MVVDEKMGEVSAAPSQAHAFAEILSLAAGELDLHPPLTSRADRR